MTNCINCNWYIYGDGLVCHNCMKKNTRWMQERTPEQCKADANDNTWMLMGDLEEDINIDAYLENKIMLELRRRYQ